MTDTTTQTLAEFLLARIAEDEAEVGDGPHGDWKPIYRESRNRLESTHDGLMIHPTRVLAECEAMRRIVEQVERNVRDVDPGWCERIFAHLALPYADHLDYREEWR